MNNWEPEVRFEDGVYKFNLPNGDEFVIVPPTQSTEDIKKRIKHSLCGGNSSIQSRVYLDGEEISKLKMTYQEAKVDMNAIFPTTGWPEMDEEELSTYLKNIRKAAAAGEEG